MKSIRQQVSYEILCCNLEATTYIYIDCTICWLLILQFHKFYIAISFLRSLISQTLGIFQTLEAFTFGRSYGAANEVSRRRRSWWTRCFTNSGCARWELIRSLGCVGQAPRASSSYLDSECWTRGNLGRRTDTPRIRKASVLTHIRVDLYVSARYHMCTYIYIYIHKHVRVYVYEWMYRGSSEIFSNERFRREF